MISLALYAFLLLCLVWVGYPAAVFCLGALRRRQPAQGKRRDASVSVIVASSDGAASIRQRVADLLATTYPADRLEVIVALDAVRARASAAELSGLDPRVRVVPGDLPGGKAATLNAGVRAARHEVLVFADTAQRFDPAAIGELVDALARPRVGAVSGMLDLGSGTTGGVSLADRYWRYERRLRRWEASLHSCVGVTGAIYAMHRPLWEPLPGGLILDDVYVPMRLALGGWRIGFSDRAVATDVRRFAAGQEYRRKVRTLTGVIQLCCWLPGVLNPLRNPIWVQFTFHKLLRLLTPYLAVLVAAGFLWFTGLVVASGAVSGPLLTGVAVGGALLVLVPRVRRMAGAQLRWGGALLGATVVATLNGLRGQWDVWQQQTGEVSEARP